MLYFCEVETDALILLSCCPHLIMLVVLWEHLTAINFLSHFFFDQVYRGTVEPIIPTIFQRTKATCFAYGQTGMFGFLFYHVMCN